MIIANYCHLSKLCSKVKLVNPSFCAHCHIIYHSADRWVYLVMFMVIVGLVIPRIIARVCCPILPKI